MSLAYFEQREKSLLGDRYETLYTPCRQRAERGITVNALRASVQEVAGRMGALCEPSPFCPQGLVLLGEQVKPGRHPYYHAGVYYSQEPSASSAAALLEVQPGMRVLDLCAAPGGKSSQLGSALGGQGLLVSNEYNASRAEILKSNLERMGFPNAVILNESTDRIAEVLPGFFDRVLVDAPCSGEGMFRKEPQAMAQHNEGLVRQCAALGAQILENAAQCLAPGGILVYSTCTFAPEEDEAQVGAFLQKHPEFTLLPTTEAFGSPGEANRLLGMQADTGLMRRIWPCQGGEGHFLARLQKSADAPAAQRPAPKKARQKPPKPVPEWAEFAKEYFPLLQNSPARLAGEAVVLPIGCPPEMEKLHIVRGSIRAGTIKKGRFEPAHHLFMVYGAQCSNCEQLTLDDARTEAWLRGEEIEAQTAQKGWCAVLVDGFPLGFGKVSGGKIKNHYPKALRNLK